MQIKKLKMTGIISRIEDFIPKLCIADVLLNIALFVPYDFAPLETNLRKRFRKDLWSI